MVFKFFNHKNQTRRIISEVVILSVVFGFAAGIVGQLVADVYLDPWRLYNVERPDADTQPVVPELRWTKRFLGIEQDFQVEQALRQNSSTVVGLYRLKRGADVLTKLYQPSELLGNGMLLTSDGWIVTHQAALGNLKAEQLAVVYRNQAFGVLSAVTDKMTGVVFIKIAQNNLPVIILGDSDENMTGQLAVTRNALGEAAVPLIQKPDFQLITASADFVRSSEAYADRVLLDGDLLASYVGAPLLNLAGEVTGVINAVDREQQRATAVPLNQFRGIMLNLLKNQAIQRIYLGVEYLDFSQAPGLDQAITRGLQQGALVYRTPLRQSPAADAGIKANDIIVSVDGQAVDVSNDLTKLIQQYQPGDVATITLLRDGTQLEVEVTLALLPE
ncbi:MAG: hypothetical protein A3J59_02550 [Candidatus Buchananbacteria bacterium RIFCSPHIGHO2_02_FULL_56_16]|uniref:PDZ domain-containing protein n=1 Tax=Candidatus Buchananbacteria bacterium RIFCSPHIGHO2_02_FULL_56_16 TaxID=1797542 RepID=A0A1G1YGF8_9BACT|nr:MAG: hypothetical protein A3J59_02550 [Candidatus Buchananbacteria bacterium RIFCSPHIGHO2_02_FULL_56_16]